jgi:hypothetical protein
MTELLWRLQIRKRIDRAQMAIAWRLPRWLVRWAAVRVIAHATTGRYDKTVVPELPAMEALSRWDVT